MGAYLLAAAALHAADRPTGPNMIDAAAERDVLRMRLSERAASRAVDALRDWHTIERKAERDAPNMILLNRDALALASTGKGQRKAAAAVGAARRRDQLQKLATNVLSGEQVFQACASAVTRARVPADHADDVMMGLAEHVIAKHGPHPMACDVSANGLRQLATTFYLYRVRREERANGARATAEQLSAWQQQNRDSAKAAQAAEAHASGDHVMALAAGQAAPAPEDTRALDRICDALADLLTPGQVAAVRLALTTADHGKALTGAERVAWHRACRLLAATFPTVASLRAHCHIAFASDETLARRLVEACQRVAAREAKVRKTGNGTAVTGRSVTHGNGGAACAGMGRGR